MPRNENLQSVGNNSTRTAPVPEVRDILNLSDEEILLRFQSLTQDELRDLVPVLRATMYVFAMR